MQLIPLIDSSGALRAWADRKTGWIYNRTGNAFALVEFDGVFRFSGAQIAWWFGDHIRNRYGRVVLSRPGAKIEGLNMPRPERTPAPPKIYQPSGRPPLQWILPPPMKRHAWADVKSLFDDGLAPVRAFEEQLRRLANKPVRLSQRNVSKGTA